MYEGSNRLVHQAPELSMKRSLQQLLEDGDYARSIVKSAATQGEGAPGRNFSAILAVDLPRVCCCFS